MKEYKNIITLNRNRRGCYIIDTIKGCSGILKYKGGCYNDCYAFKIANRYGFDFSSTIKRDFYKNNEQLDLFGFEDDIHMSKIIKAIKKISMPFIRIGEMGDPSENWEHTISVCKILALAKKPIVVITKHWKKIPDLILNEITKLNICINTSVSALDDYNVLKYRLEQYNKLKNYCKSVLRIVSCNFNLRYSEGQLRTKIQDDLFQNDKIIDTVFRPDKNNPLIVNKIINVETIKFLNTNMVASIYDKNTYFGYCNNCPDMCGVTL